MEDNKKIGNDIKNSFKVLKIIKNPMGLISLFLIFVLLMTTIAVQTISSSIGNSFTHIDTFNNPIPKTKKEKKLQLESKEAPFSQMEEFAKVVTKEMENDLSEVKSIIKNEARKYGAEPNHSLSNSNYEQILGDINSQHDYIETLKNEAIEKQKNKPKIFKETIKKQKKHLIDVAHAKENDKNKNKEENKLIINMNPKEKSGLSAKHINYLISKYEGSRINGYGSVFIEMENKYKVNALFALAVATIETSQGKHLTNAGSLFNIGAFNSAPTEGHKYSKKQESIMAFGDLIRNSRYYQNKNTVAEIGKVYCSPPENWIKNVQNYMRKSVNMLNGEADFSAFDNMMVTSDYGEAPFISLITSAYSVSINNMNHITKPVFKKGHDYPNYAFTNEDIKYSVDHYLMKNIYTGKMEKVNVNDDRVLYKKEKTFESDLKRKIKKYGKESEKGSAFFKVDYVKDSNGKPLLTPVTAKKPDGTTYQYKVLTPIINYKEIEDIAVDAFGINLDEAFAGEFDTKYFEEVKKINENLGITSYSSDYQKEKRNEEVRKLWVKNRYKTNKEPLYQIAQTELRVLTDCEAGQEMIGAGEIILGDVGKGEYQVPIPESKIITSKFGWRSVIGGSSYHRGVDFRARTPLKCVSIADGIVIGVYESDIRGKVVDILIKTKSNQDITVRYQHLSTQLVRVGQQVQKGEVIAKTGSTGIGTGPHLHFETCKGKCKAGSWGAGAFDPITTLYDPTDFSYV